MAKKKVEKADPIQSLSNELMSILEEFFGNCEDRDGVYRTMINHLGVVDGSAIFEVMLTEGMNPEAPYGVLNFHITLADNVPDEALANLLISINSLNHVISAGAFSGFGNFCYYEPLKQVYMSYRMPVNINNIEGEYDNIRYYIAIVYEQLDILLDFIMFAIMDPGGMTIGDYMEYLDSVADLNDLKERFAVLEEEFARIAEAAGYDMNGEDGEEPEEEDEEEQE
jgi:hypothetical protein